MCPIFCFPFSDVKYSKHFIQAQITLLIQETENNCRLGPYYLIIKSELVEVLDSVSNEIYWDHMTKRRVKLLVSTVTL